MNEMWCAIPGHGNRYEVSNIGRVRSLYICGIHRIKIMKPLMARGYHYVCLSRKNFTIHRLVCAAFIGPRPEGHQVNHKNGIKTDNRLENLEYCTPSQNMKHCYRIGLASNAGENHSQHKISEAISLDIKRRYMGGETQSSIALDVGIDPSQVSRICSGKAWSKS